MTTVESLMAEAASAIAEDLDRARRYGGVYKFVLDGIGGRTFILDLGEYPKVVDGDGDADCTIYMEASDFIALMEGRADRRALFFMGKLSVEGDWGLAMKLKDIDELRAAENGR
jgi:putative sterol carrier protein